MRLEIYAPGVPIAADAVVIPPGLSDAPTADALEPLRAFALRGGNVLGVADGVAWLCAAGLLPGEIGPSETSAAPTHVRVEGRATAFTWAIPAGRILALAALPAAARYVAPDEDILALGARGRIVLRYCDASGGVRRPLGGGRAAEIAGISDESGRVVGLLAPASASLDTDLGRQLLMCLRGRRGGVPPNPRVAESSRAEPADRPSPTASRLDSATLAQTDP